MHPFTHTFIQYIYGQRLLYEGQFGFQYLAQAHLIMQVWKTGIEPRPLWLEDNHSTPSATATQKFELNKVIPDNDGVVRGAWTLHVYNHYWQSSMED